MVGCGKEFRFSQINKNMVICGHSEIGSLKWFCKDCLKEDEKNLRSLGGLVDGK